MLNGQKIFTTSAHFADWYWVGARTDTEVRKHNGISLFMIRMDDPGLTVHPMPTMGGERTNGVFFDDVFVHDDYMVGDVNKGFQYIAEALDIERFTLFTFSPIRGRVQLLCDYVKTVVSLRDAASRYQPYSEDPDAPMIPEELANDLRRTKEIIGRHERNLRKFKTDEQHIIERFDGDISRFKTLKGLADT